MRGTPWEPEPGRIGGEIRPRLEAWDTPEIMDGPRLPDGVDAPRRTNRQWITKKDINETYGPTPGCPGCNHALSNLPGARPHTEACRERFEK